MIRPIVTARLMLRQPSEPATSTDAEMMESISASLPEAARESEFTFLPTRDT